MTDLPNRENAVVPFEKLPEYVLSETTRDGKAKARFFRHFGYEQANAHLLLADLLSLARTYPVIEIGTTRHGVKYLIDGAIRTPIGRPIRLRTVWIMEPNRLTPRFVTAYPLEEEELLKHGS